MTPDQQRAVAGYLAEQYKISQRRAGRVIGRSRSTLRYDRKRRSDDPPLVREIKRLARRHPRFGYRRVHVMLDRKGWSVNLKRVHRLWIELGLRRPMRRKKPGKLGAKPGVGGNSCVRKPARFKNDVWTCDFIHDRTAGGRPLKWLTLVDEYTRECLVLHAAGSMTGADVRRIVARVVGRRGSPTRIRSDNGSEFICEALTSWWKEVGSRTDPGGGGEPVAERLHRVVPQPIARRVPGASGVRERGGRSGERGLVPSGIQHDPAAQFDRIQDAARVQRGV